ncbi:MAG: nucleotidyltransferase domain-containing protein [Candidatus Margulisiibacteriota bacterium]
MISLKSEITQQVLNYFFLNPQESLYINELARQLSLDKRNLVKKIKELENDGLLISWSRGNLKLYAINRKFPLYKEYKNIVLKTVGFEKELKDVLKGTAGAEKAYIYGSYARDKMDAHSDIDLLVIGNHGVVLLQRKISRLQKKIGREINAVNMSAGEFRKRRANQDPFLQNILKNKYIEIKNEI